MSRVWSNVDADNYTRGSKVSVNLKESSDSVPTTANVCFVSARTAITATSARETVEALDLEDEADEDDDDTFTSTGRSHAASGSLNCQNK